MNTTSRPATMRDAYKQAVTNLSSAYPDMCDWYLSRLTPVSYKAGTLLLAASDQVTYDMCVLRLHRLVRNELWLVLGKEIAVEYVLQLQEGGASC